jgi:chaperone modulatory protein CbpM
MTTIESLIDHLSGLTRHDIEAWISNDWVRPDGGPGDYAFRRIDVARVRLIHQLRVDMQVNDESLPIVLSLLDQLYDQRRRMRELGEALLRTASPEIIQILTQHLLNNQNNKINNSG